MNRGRSTLSIENNIGARIQEVVDLWSIDAVRNSNGTDLPPIASQLGAKIYEAYFVEHGDQDWAKAHPQDRPQFFLTSQRCPTLDTQPLEVQVMKGCLELQVEPVADCNLEKCWQVIDRSTGKTLAPHEWEINETGAQTTVTIARPQAEHTYTVDFLAWQNWDLVQTYNYITNHWESVPDKVREQLCDIRYTETWEYIKAGMDQWLAGNPQVDVVRFTTFFYRFMLVFNDREKEKLVEWFGYLESVSETALQDFGRRYGYTLTPGDFVDEGYYNSAFRVPRKEFLGWITSINNFVTEKTRILVEEAHAAGKTAMMFLRDHWTGVEPYGGKLAAIGLDAVMDSVGSAATCRMISDIPDMGYAGGRFLPYFFPDVFHEGGIPLAELKADWLQARRTIMRSPLDRMGYGGYLSLALKLPEFVLRVGKIAQKFRSLHEETGGEKPAVASVKVIILNAWGKRHSWMASMVTHTKLYFQAYAHEGILEALVGLPFEMRFINFEDVRAGALADVDVVTNAGTAGTTFSGGTYWADSEICTMVRDFVAHGGGIIGIGYHSAAKVLGSGAFFQLSGVFGVDLERSWLLSTDRYVQVLGQRFIPSDLSSKPSQGRGPKGIGVLEIDPQPQPGCEDTLVDIGPGTGFAVPTDGDVLRFISGGTDVAVNDYDSGQTVYLAGLPYNHVNSRVLHRAIYWATSQEDYVTERYLATDSWVKVAHCPGVHRLFVYNNSAETAEIALLESQDLTVELLPRDSRWTKLL